MTIIFVLDIEMYMGLYMSMCVFLNHLRFGYILFNPKSNLFICKCTPNTSMFKGVMSIFLVYHVPLYSFVLSIFYFFVIVLSFFLSIYLSVALFTGQLNNI